jgi:hypothetical protein
LRPSVKSDTFKCSLLTSSSIDLVSTILLSRLTILASRSDAGASPCAGCCLNLLLRNADDTQSAKGQLVMAIDRHLCSEGWLSDDHFGGCCPRRNCRPSRAGCASTRLRSTRRQCRLGPQRARCEVRRTPAIPQFCTYLSIFNSVTYTHNVVRFGCLLLAYKRATRRIIEGARPADTMQHVLFQPMLFLQVAMQTVDRSTPACSPIHGAIQRPICTSLQMLVEFCVGALLSTLSCSPSPSALAKPQSTVMLAKTK